MTNSLTPEMKIACCLTCTLSETMRDCKNCPFRAGLLVKTFEQVKAQSVDVDLSARREAFVAAIRSK